MHYFSLSFVINNDLEICSKNYDDKLQNETGREKEKKKRVFRSLDERDGLDCIGVSQSGDISGGVAQGLGLDDTAHDLAGPCLGHIVDEVNRLWIGYRSQRPSSHA